MEQRKISNKLTNQKIENTKCDQKPLVKLGLISSQQRLILSQNKINP